MGSCLFRRRLAATRKRRQRLSVDPGHRPKWPPTRLAGRPASLCRAIPNVGARGAARESSALVRRSPELTQRSERCADLFAKKFRLFPRSEATAAPSFAGIRLLTEAVALPARPLWA